MTDDANHVPRATPYPTADGESRVVPELPSWLASLAYRAQVVAKPLHFTIRVPIPPLAYLQQWAQQREIYEHELQLQQAGVLGIRAIEPSFDVVFQATEDQGRAIAQGLTAMLDKASDVRGVIDVD